MMAAESKETAFVHYLDDHGSRLVNYLHALWKDEKYCDLVIITQSRSLPVHACVMAAFSPKIASLISKQNLQNKAGTLNMYTIKVKFNYDVVESIVKAVYTGIFQSASKHLKEVLLAAKWLQMAELICALKIHTDGLAKQRNMDLLASKSSNKFLHPTVNVSLSSSPADWNSEVPKFEDVLECIHTPPTTDLDVNTATQNKKSNSSQKDTADQKNSTVIKAPEFDEIRQNTNMRISVKPLCTAHSDNITGLSESKREFDEISNSDKRMNKNSDKESKRTARLLKPRILHNSETVLPKKGKNAYKPKVNTAKGGSLRKKSTTGYIKQNRKNSKDTVSKVADETSDQQGQENVQSNHLKIAVAVEAEGNLESNLIGEIDNNDPVKDELDLIMGSVGFIKCNKCFVKFTDVDLYKSHVQNHPTLECTQCGQRFLNKFMLSKHIYSVHFGMEHLVCRHCRFAAKSQVELRKHAMDVHNDRKPFPCSHKGCKFTAMKHHQVFKHMIIHSEEKEFICDKCSASFLRHTGLINHQRTCYQLQEFLCDLCGQSFNHKHSMRKHRRIIHFGEKPYKCSVCSNSFGDHRNLHRHMRIHENSFPYVCSVCKQQFRHSNSLKAHVATKHKDHPENIQLNVNKVMQGNAGGVSYKRILKNDHINKITSRVEGDEDSNKKKKQCKITQEVPSPTQMFESTSFAGEFLIPLEDSNFDMNNSSDLECVMNVAHPADSFTCNLKPLNLNGESGAITEEDGEVPRLFSDQNVSSNSFLAPQMPQVVSSGKIKSPQHRTDTLPSPPSLQQSDKQKSLLSHINISDECEANPGIHRSLTVPNISKHTFSQPHSSLQKLQQSSQQALQKYLSQNHGNNELSKVETLPGMIRAASITDHITLASPSTSSQHFQTINSVSTPGTISVPSRITGLIRGTEAKQDSSGSTDIRCAESGNQFTPVISTGKSETNLTLQVILPDGKTIGHVIIMAQKESVKVDQANGNSVASPALSSPTILLS